MNPLLCPCAPSLVLPSRSACCAAVLPPSCYSPPPRAPSCNPSLVYSPLCSTPRSCTTSWTSSCTHSWSFSLFLTSVLPAVLMCPFLYWCTPFCTPCYQHYIVLPRVLTYCLMYFIRPFLVYSFPPVFPPSLLPLRARFYTSVLHPSLIPHVLPPVLHPTLTPLCSLRYSQPPSLCTPSLPSGTVFVSWTIMLLCRLQGGLGFTLTLQAGLSTLENVLLDTGSSELVLCVPRPPR